MNICVVNGSPRGNYSTTVHTCLYLEKRYPGHHFEYLNVGNRINSFEKDMGEAVAALERAELILFSYPVYTFIAPSQLHRFIAALKASGADLAGKYATQITTSKHFYDVTAHRYIEDNCHDLGLKVIRGLSADMDDLTTDQGRRDAENFFEYALWCVENDVHEPRPACSDAVLPPYQPAFAAVQKQGDFEAVIVADLRAEDARLQAMIADFQAVFPPQDPPGQHCGLSLQGRLPGLLSLCRGRKMHLQGWLRQLPAQRNPDGERHHLRLQHPGSLHGAEV